ncbi:MAG: ATP-binding cassette domain-containing protein, partial [Pirellulaceae bacterium]
MIVIQNMSIQSGEFRLTDVELTVPTGGYAVLMGETGCGKTTILESVLGLRKITSGKILLGNRDVTQL